MRSPSCTSSIVARAACALLLCGAVRAQAPVFVVDINSPPPAPGVDFAQIATAVGAVPGGSILLVHAGTYQPFTVDGKSLTIVAAGLVTVGGNVTVRGLLADQSVVLRGLESTGKTGESGLRIEGCAGPVWIESCSPTGGVGGGTPDGLYVTTCLAVTLVRSDIKGGEGVLGDQFQSSSGWAGLRIRTCNVAAWDVTAVGGDGWQNADNGGHGGAGVLVWESGQLAATGGTFEGGTGVGGDSHWDFFCGCELCYFGGTGGPGLQVDDNTGSGVDLRDVLLQGGEGVYNQTSFCPGNPGPALKDFGQLVTTLTGDARSLQLSSPAAEGEMLHLSLLGQPGDAALVLVSFAPAFTELSYGTLALLPQIVSVIGALPPTGDLQLDFLVPELGPGVEGLLLLAQPIFQPAGGGKLLGSPSATVLLDVAF